MWSRAKGSGGICEDMVGGAVQSLGWMRKEGEEEGRKTEKGGLGRSQIAARWEAGWRDGGFRGESALVLVSVKGVGCGCRDRLSEWTVNAGSGWILCGCQVCQE